MPGRLLFLLDLAEMLEEEPPLVSLLAFLSSNARLASSGERSGLINTFLAVLSSADFLRHLHSLRMDATSCSEARDTSRRRGAEPC